MGTLQPQPCEISESLESARKNWCHRFVENCSVAKKEAIVQGEAFEVSIACGVNQGEPFEAQSFIFLRWCLRRICAGE